MGQEERRTQGAQAPSKSRKMNLVARSATALGSLVVLGLASACGAPAETDAIAKTDTALITTPTLSAPPPLSQVTGAPVDDGATCGSTPVAPPTSLADFDCSWGVEVLHDPALVYGQHYPDPTATTSTGEAVQAFAWACLAVSSSGVSVDTWLQTTQAPWGGPVVQTDGPWHQVTTTATYSDSCVGTPDAGYVLVFETFVPTWNILPPPGGCAGNACDVGSGGATGGASGGGVRPGLSF